jgi:4-oxalocrotonate tautomerase
LKETALPHVIVKLWPGKSEEQKARLAEKISQDVMSVLGCGEESVSVSLEEVSSRDWESKVYEPDIVSGAGKLYKRPGYGPADFG